MHHGKICALPSSGMTCTVSGESTLQRKGVLVKRHIQPVPKKRGSKNLRTATQLEAYGFQPNPQLIMRPTSQGKGVIATLDFRSKARICLGITPGSCSNSHDPWICEGFPWKLLGFFC